MIFQNEAELYRTYHYVAGVDEAGRGPLAGPLVVAAVILGENAFIHELDDSKKLTEAKRNILYDTIKEEAIAWEILAVPPEVIDEVNILQATLNGMKKAVENLGTKPDVVLIDGNRIPDDMLITPRAIVRGDSTYASIAAASVLAKVTRDRIMIKLHEKHPQYNFAQNKGYPTPEHLRAIAKYGLTEHHRKSYKPCQEVRIDFE